MRTLLLVCLSQLACACTPHEIRCDGRLEPINAPVPAANPDPRKASQTEPEAP